jgi:hypothetical protein
VVGGACCSVASAVGGASVGNTSVSAVVASTGGDDSSASAQAVIKTTTRAAITINFIFMYNILISQIILQQRRIIETNKINGRINLSVHNVAPGDEERELVSQKKYLYFFSSLLYLLLTF